MRLLVLIYGSLVRFISIGMCRGESFFHMPYRTLGTYSPATLCIAQTPSLARPYLQETSQLTGPKSVSLAFPVS